MENQDIQRLETLIATDEYREAPMTSYDFIYSALFALLQISGEEASLAYVRLLLNHTELFDDRVSMAELRNSIRDLLDPMTIGRALYNTSDQEQRQLVQAIVSAVSEHHQEWMCRSLPNIQAFEMIEWVRATAQ